MHFTVHGDVDLTLFMLLTKLMLLFIRMLMLLSMRVSTGHSSCSLWSKPVPLRVG